MDALTPAERRGAIVVVVLLALGAFQDLWRASRPLPSAPPSLHGHPVPPLGAAPGAQGRGAGGDASPDGGAGAPGLPGAVVDLNRASTLELDALPGVGPVLAGRIVAYRERHGPFGHPEELLAVRGIGSRLFARLRSRVTVGSAPPGSGDGRPAGLQSAARPVPLRADSGSGRPSPLPITRQD